VTKEANRINKANDYRLRDSVGITISFSHIGHIPFTPQYRPVFTYPMFYGQTCDLEFPATYCFHHIVAVAIPESNAACMRLVYAMHTLHTSGAEFAKRSQTSPTVKFSASMLRILSHDATFLIFLRKKRASAQSLLNENRYT